MAETTVTAVGNYQPAQAANQNEQEKAKILAEIKKLEKEYSAAGKYDEAKLNKINQLKDKYRELCGVKITPENSCTRDLFNINQKNKSNFGPQGASTFGPQGASFGTFDA